MIVKSCVSTRKIQLGSGRLDPPKQFSGGLISAQHTTPRTLIAHVLSITRALTFPRPRITH